MARRRPLARRQPAGNGVFQHGAEKSGDGPVSGLRAGSWHYVFGYPVPIPPRPMRHEHAGRRVHGGKGGGGRGGDAAVVVAGN